MQSAGGWQDGLGGHWLTEKPLAGAPRQSLNYGRPEGKGKLLEGEITTRGIPAQPQKTPLRHVPACSRDNTLQYWPSRCLALALAVSFSCNAFPSFSCWNSASRPNSSAFYISLHTHTHPCLFLFWHLYIINFHIIYVSTVTYVVENVRILELNGLLTGFQLFYP